MGRTGKLWGIENFDIVPDVLCAAKALGSGVPIGATVCHRKLDFGVQGAHSNTFGGNLLACASALATIDVIEKEKVLGMAAKTGRHLRKRLDELMEKHDIIGDVRGLGMMQATELVEDRKTKKPAKKARDKVVELCYKRGVIFIPCGRSTIRYIPPLTTPVEYIDAGVEVVDSVLRDAVK
jgi:4-aminobutyrate aminotransferase